MPDPGDRWLAYDRWNQALTHYFFTPELPDRPVYLDVVRMKQGHLLACGIITRSAELRRKVRCQFGAQMLCLPNELGAKRTKLFS